MRTYATVGSALAALGALGQPLANQIHKIMSSKDLLASLMRAAMGNSAQSVSDDQLEIHVAKLMAREAAERRAKLGISRPADSEPASARAKPNLGYLQNVLKQTQSHNAVVASMEAAASSSSAISPEAAPTALQRRSRSPSTTTLPRPPSSSGRRERSRDRPTRDGHHSNSLSSAGSSSNRGSHQDPTRRRRDRSTSRDRPARDAPSLARSTRRAPVPILASAIHAHLGTRPRRDKSGMKYE
ncbi:hypothetical protein BC828DRAFT_385548 [Blastocladiella britannica]|nr:hypothetical protein BC828DRAFT_385548 [Blastocladiella britannica]